MFYSETITTYGAETFCVHACYAHTPQTSKKTSTENELATRHYKSQDSHETDGELIYELNSGKRFPQRSAGKAHDIAFYLEISQTHRAQISHRKINFP